MISLSVASRMAPQAAGKPKNPNKLFYISPKKGSFWEPLANYCINWLRMLYYECRRLNGLGSPFGFETQYFGGINVNTSLRLNGVGSPFGFETEQDHPELTFYKKAKWPGKPVWV